MPKGLMGDRESKYWKGPEATMLQSRYRALVRQADFGFYPSANVPRAATEVATKILLDLANKEERAALVDS